MLLLSPKQHLTFLRYILHQRKRRKLSNLVNLFAFAMIIGTKYQCFLPIRFLKEPPPPPPLFQSDHKGIKIFTMPVPI